MGENDLIIRVSPNKLYASFWGDLMLMVINVTEIFLLSSVYI